MKNSGGRSCEIASADSSSTLRTNEFKTAGPHCREIPINPLVSASLRLTSISSTNGEEKLLKTPGALSAEMQSHQETYSAESCPPICGKFAGRSCLPYSFLYI